MITILLDHIKQKQSIRPAGYYEDVISHGRIEGDKLIISEENHKKLAQKYSKVIMANHVHNNESTEWCPYCEEPTLIDMADNFRKALDKWIQAGLPVVPEGKYKQRLKTCSNCEYWDENARAGLGKCNHKECGCTKFKLWLDTEKCPIKKWI